MNTGRLRFSLCVALILSWSVALFSVAAHASYPNKPIRVIVPFPPGGATDSLARVLTEHMAQELGQRFIIDNRSGAGTMIGSEAAARANADGYTLLLTISSLIQAPHQYSNPPFDPVQDFTPVAQLVTTPLVLTVLGDSGIESVDDLVSKVRSEPAQHVFGSYGAGSSGHLYMHAFTEQTELDWVHVPYRGEAPSVTDLLGGQITAVIMSGVGSLAHVRSGRMNALAVTGPYRMPAMPDVPTFEELGYERMSTRGWFGLFGPAGMDPAIVKRLSDSALAALEDENVKQRIENLSLIIDALPEDEFAPVVKRDSDMWRAIIQEVGITLD